MPVLNKEYNDYSECHYCDPVDSLIDDMNYLKVERPQLTLYISGLLEKLVKEMKYEKYYDTTSKKYRLNISPPEWFNSIDGKYKNILIKLIEPTLTEYLNS